MDIHRWPSASPGRSRVVAHGGLVWTVANASDPAAVFEHQVAQTLAMLERHLAEGGSARTRLLSLQVMLVDISRRADFDRIWQDWIGPDPAHWPQRAVFQAALAPGLQVELVAVAASAASD